MSTGTPPSVQSHSVPAVVSAPSVFSGPTYEQLLTNDVRWALDESSLYFEGQGRVHQSLRKIASKLDHLGVPYAVVGGLAMFFHGYRRYTDDVDILVSADGLKKIHRELVGLGYLPPVRNSKHLRDTELKVRIEFLVQGQFPGDGKKQSISFPSPEDVAIERDGIKLVNLTSLVELKLASGISGKDRQKDLIDVQELIKALQLERGLGEELDSSVRTEYGRLWDEVAGVKKRFVMLWRNKFLTTKAQNIDDMIGSLQSAASELKAMRDDGVVLDPESGISDDYATLVTNDSNTAKKHGMVEESEFFDKDEDESASLEQGE